MFGACCRLRTLRRKGHILGCAVALICSCSAPKELEIAGRTMGTTYVVKVVDVPAALGPRELRQRIDDALERVNRQMSTYRDDSEISQFNGAAVGEWIEVSADTERVVSHALSLSQSTQGAFDITVGALVTLWGFGPDSTERLPGETDIARARERVGYDLLESRASPPALRKSADVSVDLSAVAKGFGVDQVASLLAASGVENYLVEIGGELRVRGRSARGDAWRVGVQIPEAQAVGIARRTFSMDEGAVATSGDYRNFYQRDGRRDSHLIDPRSGYPIRHRLASVTVMATTAMEADALATALNVLGPEQGMRYAIQHGIAALFIIRADGGFEEKSTPWFAELLADVSN